MYDEYFLINTDTKFFVVPQTNIDEGEYRYYSEIPPFITDNAICRIKAYDMVNGDTARVVVIYRDYNQAMVTEKSPLGIVKSMVLPRKSVKGLEIYTR